MFVLKVECLRRQKYLAVEALKVFFFDFEISILDNSFGLSGLGCFQTFFVFC